MTKPPSKDRVKELTQCSRKLVLEYDNLNDISNAHEAHRSRQVHSALRSSSLPVSASITRSITQSAQQCVLALVPFKTVGFLFSTIILCWVSYSHVIATIKLSCPAAKNAGRQPNTTPKFRNVHCSPSICSSTASLPPVLTAKGRADYHPPRRKSISASKLAVRIETCLHRSSLVSSRDLGTA